MRQLSEIGVHVDYRPGGVSLTAENFAKLEHDRRRNAERVLYLLGQLSAEELERQGIPADDGTPGGREHQIAALDQRIDELLGAHKRLTRLHATIGTVRSDAEQSMANAMRDVGTPQRFIDDAVADRRETVT